MLLTGLSFAVLLSALVDAQYETYSFKSFPQRDLMPLESAYNYAMEQYGEKNWAESIKYLELSLRLHRLLRDSEAFCSRNCSSVSRDGDGASADDSLRVMRHILLRAACLKKCKADFPVFTIAYPRRSVLETFEKRIPYRYIQYAQFQVRGGREGGVRNRNLGHPVLKTRQRYQKFQLGPKCPRVMAANSA